ncbi:MAG: cation transporter, partial [Ignavibacteriaceae bacterium]
MIETNKISLPIEGMTCASCVARVEKAVSKAEGVKNVSVNLATEKVTFELKNGQTDLSKIAALVDEAGYKIDVSSLKDKKVIPVRESSDYKSSYEDQIRRDFIIALILTIPIAIINMGMMWEGFTNFIPLSNDYLNKILLLLTTPVIF